MINLGDRVLWTMSCLIAALHGADLSLTDFSLYGATSFWAWANLVFSLVTFFVGGARAWIVR